MQKRFQRLAVAALAVLSLLVALVAGVGLTPGRAHAQAQATVSVFRMHEDTVTASFLSVDSTGCIQTQVIVEAGDEVAVIPPGGPVPMPIAVVVINQFDTCTGFLLFDGFGSTNAATLQVGPNLSTATLTANPIPIQNEVTGESFNLAVNVTWIATAPVVRQIGPTHEVFDNTVFNAIGVRFTSDAVATGTISTDSTNFIPTPSADIGGLPPTQITHFTSGEVTITQG